MNPKQAKDLKSYSEAPQSIEGGSRGTHETAADGAWQALSPAARGQGFRV